MASAPYAQEWLSRAGDRIGLQWYDEPVDHLVGKLAAAPVQRQHYDRAADHFRWARAAEPVAGRVAKFVFEVTRARPPAAGGGPGSRAG